MKAVSKILTGAAGIAALVGMAAPAAAQYYPGTGGNIIGQVLNTILNPYGQQQRYGYGQQYGQGMNQQVAVSQCSAAVQSRLAQQYSAGYGYSPYGGGYNPYAANT
ncbi:MAG: hypothetical protein H0T82_04945, partial [Sphingomonas sp.]|nr:hypothetical protein [Sphingomonas sp.]